jgi:hypothetical protein
MFARLFEKLTPGSGRHGRSTPQERALPRGRDEPTLRQIALNHRATPPFPSVRSCPLRIGVTAIQTLEATARRVERPGKSLATNCTSFMKESDCRVRLCVKLGENS